VYAEANPTAQKETIPARTEAGAVTPALIMCIISGTSFLDF